MHLSKILTTQRETADQTIWCLGGTVVTLLCIVSEHFGHLNLFYQFKINKEDGHIGFYRAIVGKWLMEHLIFLILIVFSDTNGVLCVLFANQTPN